MGTEMATSQDFATWTCGPRLEPRYLLHALRGMAPDLRRIATGSTHKTIYMPDIEQLRIPLPPVDEQCRIADFLDAETSRIDHLVSLRTHQHTLLENRFSVAVREQFLAFDTTPTRLKFLLAARPRYGVLVPKYVASGVKFIRVNDLLNLEGRADNLLQISTDVSQQYPTTVVRKNDVLVSVVGTLGRAVVTPASLSGANVNRAIAVLRTNPGINRNLLTSWINSEGFQTQAVLATGNDSAQRTLGMEDLSNFTLRWPTDKDSQTRLATRVSEMEKETRTLERLLLLQIGSLKERRQTLITAAVTGQFDVSTASGRNVTDGVSA